MINPSDFIGARFGLLTVVGVGKPRGIRKLSVAVWLCDCGNSGESLLTTIRNRSSSCGCLRHENRKTHNQTRTRLYNIWAGMIQRCSNNTHPRYKDYGARGIHVCDEWLSADVFFKWAKENGYSQFLTIDRTDNSKGYCPENCRWVSKTVQSRNSRRNVIVEYSGQSKTLIEWCEILGVNYMCVYKRLRRGWNFDDAISNFKIKQNA